MVKNLKVLKKLKKAKKSGDKDFFYNLTKKDDGTPIDGWNPETQTMDWSKATTAEFKNKADAYLRRGKVDDIVDIKTLIEKANFQSLIPSNE